MTPAKTVGDILWAAIWMGMEEDGYLVWLWWPGRKREVLERVALRCGYPSGVTFDSNLSARVLEAYKGRLGPI